MNNNTVELLGWYGSDEIHAQSAWTSTSRELTDEKKARIPKLLEFLAQNKHETPFEKSSLHFLVKVDQATHIHLLKHRIGVSINGESARYKELKEDKMYLPDDWEKHTNQKVIINDTEVEWRNERWSVILEDVTLMCNQLYHNALKDLEESLGRKRAKESARFFKPMNSQIDMDIMFNWRSFCHFLKLRKDPKAQKEVRELAEKMLELIKNIPDNPFKYTIKAFGYENSSDS